MIESPTLLALNISTLIIILFSANLLLLRSFERQAYLPLALCLLSFVFLISQPTLAVFSANLQPIILILSLPALLFIAPGFWCYVEGITATTPWQFEKRYRRHFLLPAAGLIIAFTALLLPKDIRDALLVQGNDEILTTLPVFSRYVTYALLIATFLMVLAWVIQSGFYFLKIIRRLNHYRAHLKNLFASTEAHEIRWLSWLLVAVGTVWAITAVNIILDNVFFPTHPDPLIIHGIILVMIWSISLWGLRQKPGFEELYDSEDDVLQQTEPKQGKYQRSALDQRQAAEIAEKIEHAMVADKLYLDASLSLQKLAKHITTSTNYISQTLNETLGMSFFDYVNKYRVEDAQQRLKQSKDTVLDIAMHVGFNAKSSFYTAFKKETQLTPSQYRNKQHTKSSK